MKIHNPTGELVHVKFHAKTDIARIDSRMKFNVEFPRQVMNIFLYRIYLVIAWDDRSNGFKP